MSGNELIPSLFLFTLVAAVLAAIVALVWFLRKRSNRHPMDTPRGRAIDEQHRREAEDARR